MITVGADPEFFLRINGALKSSVGLIGGTKESPASLPRKGFFIQEDNVAVEFNIPPAKTAREFVDSIDWSVTYIGQRLNANGIQIALESSAIFPETELNTPQALMFGCDPDFNAWKDGKVNPRPRSNEAGLRTCGGHVHLGYDDKFESPDEERFFRHRVVQAADAVLGVPSVLEDLDTRRALLYGKAGAFRPTSYGLEYRVLSNFWLRRNLWARWVYDGISRAYEIAKNQELYKTIIKKNADYIQEAINTRSPSAAAGFMARYGIAAIPQGL